MNQRQVELALKKQRLQLRSAALRSEFAGHALALAPLFAVGDSVRDGALWLRRHPEIAVAAAVILLLTRPRTLFRWTRRGVVAWQAWSRMRAWVEARLAWLEARRRFMQ
ncbi:MAG: hypothetical protein A2045_15740 [Rhodocyclales bacterium GWA2_65_20]|nr:MAG: hypothetical protein A2045_15740 [Rhodocyclales bacterium GWA2_65_20]